MVRYPSWLRNSLLAGWALTLPARAVEIPSGTEIQARLKTGMASNTSIPAGEGQTLLTAVENARESVNAKG